MSRRELELNVRLGDRRRAYLESHVFELLIAALGVISALTFFLDPSELARSAIGQAVHPFDYAWNALYLAGGGIIVAGLARPSYRLEVAGLLMFAGAVSAGAIALIAVAPAGISLVPSITTYVAAAAACVLRVRSIHAIEAALGEAHGELELMQGVELGRRRADRRGKR